MQNNWVCTGSRAGQKLRLIVLWLVVAAAALPLIAMTALAQGVDSTATVSDPGIDMFRRLYIATPEVIPKYFANLQREGSPLLPERYGLSVGTASILKELDRISLERTGARFLSGSSLAATLLDSLRLAYYEAPGHFPGQRLDHLDMVSRAVDGLPFLRATQPLMDRLKWDRDTFFDEPDAFDDSRLRDLDGISMRVTSLPFLRGSTELLAQLESARAQFDQDDNRFTPQRLEQLNTISMRVTGEPFVRRRDYVMLAALALGSLGFLVVVTYSLAQLTRSRPPSARPVPPPTTEMSVAEACRVLLVEPDCSLSELTRAFRTQQKKYHPDVVAHLGAEFQGMAEQRTKKINEAYELLRARHLNG